MTIQYKILFLYFKKSLKIHEIAMILDTEIRKSGVNSRMYHGKIIKDPPESFVKKVVLNESKQIYVLKAEANPDFPHRAFIKSKH